MIALSAFTPGQILICITGGVLIVVLALDVAGALLSVFSDWRDGI
jgi:hypothetical protein